jgi:DNA-binding NtrC family response regulator
MNMISSIETSLNYSFSGTAPANRQALIVIVSDSDSAVEQLQRVCAFFDLGVEVVASEEELLPMLRDHRPMAIIADVDGVSSDGFHAMRVVAAYDHDLPIMVLTHGDPVLMGAADAMQELCSLTMVSRTSMKPLAGQLAEFLFAAGRRAGCMRLVQV